MRTIIAGSREMVSRDERARLLAQLNAGQISQLDYQRAVQDFAAIHVRLAIEASGIKSQISEVVSGTARGVDRLGEEWARMNGIPVKRFPADWQKYPRAAGHIRNQQMAEYARKGPGGGAAIIVWDGKSPGSLSMIQKARKLGLYVFVYQPDSIEVE